MILKSYSSRRMHGKIEMRCTCIHEGEFITVAINSSHPNRYTADVIGESNPTEAKIQAHLAAVVIMKLVAGAASPHEWLETNLDNHSQ